MTHSRQIAISACLRFKGTTSCGRTMAHEKATSPPILTFPLMGGEGTPHVDSSPLGGGGYRWG
ncbi:MAG: hypothetical protein WBH61_03905, partial [Candidatus Methylomirabilis sp.]